MVDNYVSTELDNIGIFVDKMNVGLRHFNSSIFTFRSVPGLPLDVQCFARKKDPFSQSETWLVCKEISEDQLSSSDQVHVELSVPSSEFVQTLQSKGHSALTMYIVTRRGQLMSFFLDDGEAATGYLSSQEAMSRMMSDLCAARALISTVIY
ncbi:hypothetical protein J8L98_12945 [Pseudoalteromonas sp. MMG013]|uniref:Uncharacterized protein n=1 Tax=Pseudoalteromonas aurantia 208 TaxID=1314867 RepID=A0ABR9EDL8_9GAMM|nr:MULTISPECIES: hypothetical protein [Pseudoalteromonas]MBE0368867.1 hypothetical protein [Pseudoalteromonas aurantia 208]MBQ4846118.1 hypothetical protein [Pseudoalteromonas sp. MMG005]MBQ4851055.1 hypothetical protein [Pseudoalteromonas sp. MMG012]MBQ4862596.1 hypothetical protein [Pseudoalteromonas sp. MMG013]